MKAKDYTGQRFGRLTALCVSGRRKGNTYWKLRCDCGAIVEVATGNLCRTQSCGCLRNERRAEERQRRAEERQRRAEERLKREEEKRLKTRGGAGAGEKRRAFHRCDARSEMRARVVLRGIFGRELEQSTIPQLSRIKGIRPTKKIRNPLTEDELELLRSSARTKRDKAIIEFLYSTGCRVSEMLNLNRDDVDLNNGQAVVLGKGRKYRTVYLSARCKAVLREYLDSRDDNLEPLFLSNYDGFRNKGPQNQNLHRMTRSSVEVMIRKLGRRVGIENVHPHRFRRTAATVALRRGMPLEQVQKFLGHENIQTTTIYAQSSNDDVKQSHERFMR